MADRVFPQRRRAPGVQSGFSLTELMIAVAIGLIVLASLTTFFVQTSSNRREIDRSARQIENGRFAVDALRQEIRLAGFYAELPFKAPVVVWSTPDPCLTATNLLGVSLLTVNPNTTSMPVPFFGYASDAASPGCVTDRVAGTEVLVIRRFHTEPVPPAATVSGNPYVQISRCVDEAAITPMVLADGGNQGAFTLRPKGCPAPPAAAGVYRFRVVIFYVREWSLTVGDGVPTLVRIDLDGASPGLLRTSELVEGIRDLRFEYGIDEDKDGAPNRWSRCLAADPPCDWPAVTAVRMHVLAENLEDTIGFTDKKEYRLGNVFVGPFGDMRKRHVYSSLASANNRAGIREQ